MPNKLVEIATINASERNTYDNNLKSGLVKLPGGKLNPELTISPVGYLTKKLKSKA